MSKYITKYLSKYLKIHPKTAKNVKNRVQKLKIYLQVSIFVTNLCLSWLWKSSKRVQERLKMANMADFSRK